MDITSVLNGSGLFTLLSLLVALVAYIRNVPIPLLLRKEKEYHEQIRQLTDKQAFNLYEFKQPVHKIKCQIHRQLIILNFFQIVLVFLAVVLTGRFIPFLWEDSLDLLISYALFGLSFSLLILHIKTNGKYIISSCRVMLKS